MYPMINRYSLAVTQDKFIKSYPAVDKQYAYKKSYNISPLQKSCIIYKAAQYEMCYAVWGLLPHFSKDSSNAGNLYNAAVEGISSKASYRIPIRQSRCVIPADSYYTEYKGSWYRVMRRDRSPIQMAGLYDIVTLNQSYYISFTMITVGPNRDVAGLDQRMPAVMRDDVLEAWLDKSTPLPQVMELIKVAENYQWVYYPVSDDVATVGSNGPELHEEIKSERTLFDLV